MASNSLLLRLFTSDFFDSWLAVSYLFKYPGSIGIQQYLCNELKKFPLQEIEFFLPQLIHLLMTRPADSIALENLLLNRCALSTHIAILMLWYLQSYLSDLSYNPSSSSFKLCKRMLNQCQQILFDPSKGCWEEDEMIDSPISSRSRGKVKENVAASLIGMGSGIAGIAQPSLSRIMARLALNEGRRVRSSHQECNTPPVPENIKDPSMSPPSGLSFPEPVSKILRLGKSAIPSTPTLEELHRGEAFSLGRYIAKNASYDRDDVFSETLTRNSQDLPIGSDSESDREDSENIARSLQHHLRYSHYFHSEMQFVLTLIDISNRLATVPKTARQSSLQAELTLLNHNLPANVCIPLWCPAMDRTSQHHKVVRISPSDAVVLNSAERAPFLLQVEILESAKGQDPLEEARKADSSPTTQPASFQDQKDTFNPHSPYKPTRSSDDTMSKDISEMRSAGTSTPTLKRRTSNLTDDFGERMRTAAVLLAQLSKTNNSPSSSLVMPPQSSRAKSDFEQIRERVLKEMRSLEEKRISMIKSGGMESVTPGMGPETPAGEIFDDVRSVLHAVKHKDDPSAAVFREDWGSKTSRIRASSPYGHLPNWKLFSVIVKSGADLRQEQLALQIIREMQRIWQTENVDIWVKYYRVLVISDTAGLIETITNTISIHSLKKDAYARCLNEHNTIFTLYDYFQMQYGEPSSDSFVKAQDSFMRSLAGYSLITYILQLKDRHNGNVLVDTDGHLIHIDFGFMLANSPGSVGVEMAPFKLTQEYIDILGGVNSEKFDEFKVLLKQGFLALRKYAQNIVLLVEMMQKDSKLACFSNSTVISSLRDRFMFTLTETQLDEFIDRLIINSFGSMFTRLYDSYQYYSNGIL